MEHILNATLAGGVVIGASAGIFINPGNPSQGGSGGSGGGGNGGAAVPIQDGTAGANGLGGGGGSGGVNNGPPYTWREGQPGGSGRVILRFPSISTLEVSPGTNTVTAHPGGDKLATFNVTGNLKYSGETS